MPTHNDADVQQTKALGLLNYNSVAIGQLSKNSIILNDVYPSVQTPNFLPCFFPKFSLPSSQFFILADYESKMLSSNHYHILLPFCRHMERVVCFPYSDTSMVFTPSATTVVRRGIVIAMSVRPSVVHPSVCRPSNIATKCRPS